MLGARPFLSLVLGSLLIAPVAFAQRRPKSCRWCDRAEEQIYELQKQVGECTALLDNYTYEDEETTEDESTEPGDSASTIRVPLYSSTSDSDSDPTPRPQRPQTLVLVPASRPPYNPTDDMGGGDGFRTVAYFVNWGIYGRKYFPQTIPADKLTHVLYSFGDNRPNGEVFLTDEWSDIQIHYEGDSWNDQGNNLYGNLKQLNLLKQKNRNLKVLLSIGGWTYAHEQKHFDAPGATAQGRQAFADSCVKLIKNLGFDGIDIDWEYPQNPEQGQQLLKLLQAIRAGMDAYADELASKSSDGTRPHFALSIAAPAGEKYYKNMPLGELAQVLDFINLMAYDYAGSWDKASGHQANLYQSNSCPTCTPFNTDSVIDVYVSQGVPANKIVLGMPLYGRAFTNTTGIGQSFQGVGQGSWEAGVWDYKDLPHAGAQVHYDQESGATYSYDGNSKTLVSYDTLDMAKTKVQYIKKKGLGGAMWWELSGDRQDGGSIVTNVAADLGALEHRPNWVQYPDSQYENLKNGFPTN